MEEVLLTRFLSFMQRLLPVGNKSGIGATVRIGNTSKRMSGGMCNGSIIIATGGEGGQEEHLQ